MPRKVGASIVSRTPRRRSESEAGGSHPYSHSVLKPLGGSPVLAFPRPRWYARVKRLVDLLLASSLLLLSLPILGVAALLIRLTSPGPAFYSQLRVGQHGLLFTIYKLRTMVHNCESLTGARWSIPGDPRITPVGAFLRKCHIDELPQLWNVIRGDMSIIGPRPERPEFMPTLERAIPSYKQRQRVRPGITGLAQVQLPPDTDIGSVKRKLACDLYYIRELSLGLDLQILLCTAAKVFGVPFWVSEFIFRIPSWRSFMRLFDSGLADETSVPTRRAA
jgi:lipopolysaccharide/colanic/teichoic acid biosynthesis glycosyltransferase